MAYKETKPNTKPEETTFFQNVTKFQTIMMKLNKTTKAALNLAFKKQPLKI